MAFDLKSIERGRSIRAPRIFLYSVEGLGKTTFASQAPNPIFLFTEEGLGTLDVARFPQIHSTAEALEAIATLYKEPHDYQTVVLDTADWLETAIWNEIEAKYDAKDLAYGKGAVIAANKWSEILKGLNALRSERDMTVIVLGHTQIKRFDSPDTEPYDRYQPKLQDRASALIREWADAVFFGNYRVTVRKTDVGFKKEVSRGITTGERLMHTTEKPSHMAKNRWALPETLPLSWAALTDAITQSITPAEQKAA